MKRDLILTDDDGNLYLMKRSERLHKVRWIENLVIHPGKPTKADVRRLRRIARKAWRNYAGIGKPMPYTVAEQAQQRHKQAREAYRSALLAQGRTVSDTERLVATLYA